jgi:hypothetical protein
MVGLKVLRAGNGYYPCFKGELVLLPEDILKEQMKSLDFVSKDIEIDQIVQKGPLPTYLINGLRILKLV